MIIKVGNDIVEVARIERAMQDPKFVDRILTRREQEGREMTAEFLAGRWAAKEAVKKCLPKIDSWHKVEILPSIWGGVRVVVTPELPMMQAIHVSISHERQFATAVAILDGP